MLGSCVTVYEDAPLFGKTRLERPDFAVSQAIPLGTSANPAEAAMLQLYEGVLQRLQEAVKDRDLDGMQSLLDNYERSNLPAWLVARLHGYRAIAQGMAFQRHAMTTASLRLVAPGGEGLDGVRTTDAGHASPAVGTPSGAPAIELAAPPPIGDPLRFEFALPAPALAVHLGGQGDDDPVGFAVGITVEDLYVDGGSRTYQNQDFVWIPKAVDLAGSTVLRLPVALELPGLNAVQRSVNLRVDLMPGYVQAGSWHAPIQRTTVVGTSFTQWPRGYEAIAKAPLATLREAIRLGDAGHFAHVFLGASFTSGADREIALGLLVDQVRCGTQAQAMVAMATLRAVTGLTESLGDREVWLAWWQMRH